MIASHFKTGNLRFRDKILALDFQLIFLILILGIISLFAMYSSEQGKFGYYTQNHLYRLSAFFIVFLGVSFLRVQFWFRSAYFFYVVVLILLSIILILLFTPSWKTE